MSCNMICEGACPKNEGCGLNILDACGDCVDPPDRPAGEGGEEITPREALLSFILRDPMAEGVRTALGAALAERRASSS